MSGIMPMVNVPDAVQYGRIQAHLMAFLADTLDDGDQVPDEIPLEGVVVLTPTVGAVRFPTTAPPRTAVVQALRCPVIGGDLYPPDTVVGALPAQPGVVVVASDQPVGLPDTVQWTATFKLVGARVQPGSVTFNVPANGVVDLTTVMPVTPTPGTVVVVSTEDRERAESAAGAAASSATAAASSSLLATQKATAAVSAAAAADDAMQAASQAALDADQSRTGAAASAVAAAVAEQGAVAAQDGSVVARDAAASSATAAAQSAEDADDDAVSAASALSQTLEAIGSTIAPLGTDGKVPIENIPATAITKNVVITDESQRATIDVEQNDVASLVDTINGEQTVIKAWQLMGADKTDMANWIVCGTSYAVQAGSAAQATSATNADKVDGFHFVGMTQAEYDAAVIEPNNTIYVVTP